MRLDFFAIIEVIVIKNYQAQVILSGYIFKYFELKLQYLVISNKVICMNYLKVFNGF